MVAFHTVKPGDVLYDYGMVKMGNTTMSRMACWPVHIVEVHERTVLARWNGNSERAFPKRSVEKWRRTSIKS